MLQISERTGDGATLVAPAGSIDSTTSSSFERRLITLLAQGERRLIVDFSAIDYISSAGLRVMLVLARRIRETSGALVLCGMTNPVRHVFDLAGFLPLFDVEATRESACAHLSVSIQKFI